MVKDSEKVSSPFLAYSCITSIFNTYVVLCTPSKIKYVARPTYKNVVYQITFSVLGLYFCAMKRPYYQSTTLTTERSIGNLLRCRLCSKWNGFLSGFSLSLSYLYFSLVCEGRSLLEYCLERAERSPSPLPRPPRAGSNVGRAAVVMTRFPDPPLRC